MTYAATEVFEFGELTWPEVSALPREVPLILPLGAGYDLRLAAEALARPARMGVLPAVPYGWPGSGVEVPEAVFRPYVTNLLDCLHEDGFKRVCLLQPRQLTWDLTEASLAQPLEPQVYELGPPRARVLVVPVGHTEQHGHHLPLITDTVIIEAIGRGTASANPQDAACLPVMPYGVSTHRSAFAGTFSTGGRVFEDFYLATVSDLVSKGWDQIYLLSGHGGNCSFLTNVVKYAGERFSRAFIATAWLYLSGPDGVAALQALRRSQIGGMGHACELETALLMHLRPQLVHMDRVIDETDFIATPSYYMDWIEGGALVANPPWHDDTRTGSYGAGSLATEEHGRMWLQAAIAEKSAHIQEIKEQHRRREERRASARDA